MLAVVALGNKLCWFESHYRHISLCSPGRWTRASGNLRKQTVLVRVPLSVYFFIHNPCFCLVFPLSHSLHKGPNVWLCYLPHPLEQRKERVLMDTVKRQHYFRKAKGVLSLKDVTVSHKQTRIKQRSMTGNTIRPMPFSRRAIPNSLTQWFYGGYFKVFDRERERERGHPVVYIKSV